MWALTGRSCLYVYMVAEWSKRSSAPTPGLHVDVHPHTCTHDPQRQPLVPICMFTHTHAHVCLSACPRFPCACVPTHMRTMILSLSLWSPCPCSPTHMHTWSSASAPGVHVRIYPHTGTHDSQPQPLVSMCMFTHTQARVSLSTSPRSPCACVPITMTQAGLLTWCSPEKWISGSSCLFTAQVCSLRFGWLRVWESHCAKLFCRDGVREGSECKSGIMGLAIFILGMNPGHHVCYSQPLHSWFISLRVANLNWEIHCVFPHWF